MPSVFTASLFVLSVWCSVSYRHKISATLGEDSLMWSENDTKDQPTAVAKSDVEVTQHGLERISSDRGELENKTRASMFKVKVSAWYLEGCTTSIWGKDKLAFEIKIRAPFDGPTWEKTETFPAVSYYRKALPNFHATTEMVIPRDGAVNDFKVTMRVIQPSHLWGSYDCGGWQPYRDLRVSRGGSGITIFDRTAQFQVGGARIRMESLDPAPQEPDTAERVEAAPGAHDSAEKFQDQDALSEEDNRFCEECALSLCDATEDANDIREFDNAFQEVCSNQQCEQCPDATWPACRDAPAGCSVDRKNAMVRPMMAAFSAAKKEQLEQAKAARKEAEKQAFMHCYEMQSQKACGAKKGKVSNKRSKQKLWSGENGCKTRCEARSSTAPSGFECKMALSEFHFVKPGAGMVKDRCGNPQTWLTKVGQGRLPEECETAWRLCDVNIEDSSDPDACPPRGSKGYMFMRGAMCIATQL